MYIYIPTSGLSANPSTRLGSSRDNHFETKPKINGALFFLQFGTHMKSSVAASDFSRTKISIHLLISIIYLSIYLSRSPSPPPLSPSFSLLSGTHMKSSVAASDFSRTKISIHLSISIIYLSINLFAYPPPPPSPSLSLQFGTHMKSSVAASDFSRTKTLAEQRAFLPIYGVRQQLLNVIRDNSVRLYICTHTYIYIYMYMSTCCSDTGMERSMCIYAYMWYLSGFT